MNNKTCSRCHVAKSVAVFPKNCRMADGLHRLCFECSSAQSKEVRRRRKWKVLLHYGNGNLVCVCCGEDKYEFLTLDHILGNGKSHRENVGDVYTWAVRNNFPSGLRVLCMNCNISFGLYGYCPHDGGSRVVFSPPVRKPAIRSIGIEKARTIKCMLKSVSVNGIHRAIGVSRVTIQRIKQGRSWKEA